MPVCILIVALFTCWELIFLCCLRLSHVMHSRPHAAFCSDLVLRQGLTRTLSHQPLGTGNSKSSHTGGDTNSLWQHKSLSMVEKPMLIHCILLSV